MRPWADLVILCFFSGVCFTENINSNRNIVLGPFSFCHLNKPVKSAT